MELNLVLEGNLMSGTVVNCNDSNSFEIRKLTSEQFMLIVMQVMTKMKDRDILNRPIIGPLGPIQIFFTNCLKDGSE